MSTISCTVCDQTFCSRYNLMRHKKTKHFEEQPQHKDYKSWRLPQGIPEYQGAHLGAPGAHLGAPGAHLGAPRAHFGAPGEHLGAPGTHLGAPRAHLGAPRAHFGAPGVHLGAPRAPRAHFAALGAHLEAPGAHLGAPGAPAFKFKHPCSIVLTGPSGSGKSVLIEKILREKYILPPPQRIIWCYGQYQPLYDDVKRHLPEVEFVKGIPDFIDQDTYLDVAVRNCIILDDLMGDAKKDERVANLFTKGSHHRNLTVLYLTQNLFPQGKSSRDISLNTKYLVLFNNPVDRMQVSNLARRIYPTNSHLFMNTYKRAVERPYGHLVVDLQANTAEQDRLRENILNGYKTYEHGSPALPVVCSSDTYMSKVIRDTPPYYHQDTTSCSSDESDYSEDCDIDMPICDYCGIMFGDVHALQNHVKQWCVERKRKLDHEDVDTQMTDEPKKKKWITLPDDDESDKEEEINDESSDTDDSQEDESSEDDEGEVFCDMFNKVQDLNESVWQRKYNKYLDHNMSEEEAKSTTNKKMMSIYTDDVIEIYNQLIHHIYQLQRGTIHRQVMKDVEKYKARNMEEKLAINIATKKNKHLNESILETLDSDDVEKDETEKVESEEET